MKKAYLTKEKTILKRTPIFFIQCLIIPILYPVTILVISIGLLAFAKLTMNDLWNGIHEIFTTSFGTAIFISAGQILYMTNFSSIISISREGKYAKLVKYLPINLNEQFNFKLNIGIKINTVIAILVSVCNYICIQNIGIALMFFSILMLLNVIEEKLKLLTDLKKPKTNWESEYTMMKENTNVMYVLFYTLIVVVILVLTGNIIENNILYLLFVGVSLMIINIVFNRYIKANQREIFSKVY